MQHDLELVYTEARSQWTERDKCVAILREEALMKGEKLDVLRVMLSAPLDFRKEGRRKPRDYR